jgi:LexA-binding, inner membrane-associated putative hydrolase
MAGFRMHVSTSTVLGCGYAGVLNLAYGVPLNTAIVSGAMCGFSGMLPDLDSDYGVPLRETMAFTAATVPMMLVARFQSLGLGHDTMALAAVGMYLFVRFGVTKMIRKYTVHRGMFHSFPTMLIFGGLAFLITGASPIDVRCYKAGGVMGGFLSHLILDEIYAVEWKGGRWRFKKSFGTAMKFWGDDHWSNFSTYAKLALVGMAIIGEPSVMKQLEANNPQLAGQINDLRNRIGTLNPNGLPQQGNDMARAAADFFKNAVSNQDLNVAPAGNWPQQAMVPQPFNPGARANNLPPQWQWPAAGPTYNNGNGYDTAQRPNVPFTQ